MRSNRILILGVVLFALTLGCGLIYGRVSASVTNDFELGVVDISLEEYRKVGDEELPWEDPSAVLPGDTISKIPRIINHGVDCYVRAKLAFREMDDLTEDNIKGFGDEWYKADDGYYYYTNILPQGESVDIFRAVYIPVDFSQEHEGKEFYLDVTVDAIQSVNFTPAFDTAAPWGGVEILECEKEGQYDVNAFKAADTQTFQVVYQGEVEALITSHEDFFLNIPYLMPGDIYSDTVTLKNNGNKGVQLFFRSETEDPSDLLDKIKLQITVKQGNTTSIYYNGSLRAEELNRDNILAMIPAGEEGELIFQISVPAELNNAYSLLASNVRWTFSTEEIPPHTGDVDGVEGFLILAILSGYALAVLLFVAWKLKRGNRAC